MTDPLSGLEMGSAAHLAAQDEEASRCRVLWLFVIYRAVRDFVMTKKAMDVEGRRLYAEVHNWLFSSDMDRANSFSALCMATETHPEWWRALTHLTPGELRRLELRDYRRTGGFVPLPENSDGD